MIYDITIGIPVYKARDYIDKTLESALSQSYPSIEFLIIDDCGEDGSMTIVQQYQKNHLRGKDIRVIKNNGNFGVSYSRNKIIEKAKGKYLFFLDSDDFIAPHTIQLLYDSVIKSRSEVVYGSYKIIDNVRNAPEEVYQKESMVLTNKGELATYAFINSSIFHVSVCNCLFQLSFLRQTGIRFIDVQYWEDLAFTYEFIPRVNSAVLLSDITYYYIRRPESLSHYQQREYFDKKEILKNVSVIEYVKEKCKKYRKEEYYPYLCYDLEINSFYIVCHILKNHNHICPKFNVTEMREILTYPLSLGEVLRFKHKSLSNFLMWLLSKIPVFVFLPTIWLLAKAKKAI